jgi:flagellum-specific ATP synthase
MPASTPSSNTSNSRWHLRVSPNSVVPMDWSVRERFDKMNRSIGRFQAVEKVGRVLDVTGLVIESEGPDVPLGQVCEIASDRHKESFAAEVVGFRGNRVLLIPLEAMQGIHPGCQVVASPRGLRIPVGTSLLGRILDGLGSPLDGMGALKAQYEDMKAGGSINPMKRRRIDEVFQTGVKAIDSFVPVGVGQRLGIFAGSGVGKSTLLGMLARGSSSDVNVIALVGERGRELREFIEKDLGDAGMRRSVVVISTSDQSAPMRIRAARLAIRIAEEFRDSGRNVLFLMDSVTRLAMAQREIGLAVGEPPATRGYTPSVFSLLPRLLERSGMGERGSITAFYTVLVEGDDMNEPVADAVRGILDGHLVLDRALATANHFPAINVLESVSRLIRDVCSQDEVNLIGEARDLLAIYRKNEDLINIGAYAARSNPRIDRAIAKYQPIMQFLKQNASDSIPRTKCFEQLRLIMR